MTISTHPTRTDSLLRLAMRADAVLTGVAGLVGFPLADWLARVSGTSVAFEKEMALFFIAYGVVVFGLSLLPSVKGAGMAVIIANVVYTIGAVALVLWGPFDLTTLGVVLTLASGVYTLVFAELQYQGWRRIKA
ncbi:MAG TPA: hypothetical protein VM093_09795 [Aeromicrobium sp.]|nr:hypothetical protein [Aeromicrobium sp.]